MRFLALSMFLLAACGGAKPGSTCATEGASCGGALTCVIMQDYGDAGSCASASTTACQYECTADSDCTAHGLTRCPVSLCARARYCN